MNRNMTKTNTQDSSAIAMLILVVSSLQGWLCILELQKININLRRELQEA